MRELPKIAHDRLAARPVQSAHLDANLITAFVERALKPKERQRVIAHMAVCEPCRAEVRLVIGATQADTGAPEPVRAALVAPRSWWRRWQSLVGWRTASAVTAVAAISFALWVVLRLPNSRGVRSAAPAPSPAPMTVASRSAPALAPAPRAAGSQPSTNSASQSGVKKMPTAEARAYQSAGGLRPGTDYVRVQALASSGNAPPPAPVKPGVSQAAVQTPAPSAPPAEANMSLTALPPAQQPPRQNVAASVKGEGVSAQERERSAAVMSLRRSLVGSAAASTGASRFAGRTARWTIKGNSSPGGQAGRGTVERSLDGGRTWQSVPVAAGATFRVVFASGRDVWAGGNEGAFFHSGDWGQHWSAVALPTNSGTVAGEITSIQFADATHGVVSASSGQTWITTDGGQSWQQGP